MDNKKIRLVLLVFIIILLYFGGVFLLNREITKEDRIMEKQEVLLINADYMYVKTNENWARPTKEQYNNLLKAKKYQVYSNGNSLGTYNITYFDYYFHYYDEFNNPQKIAYPAIFYSSNSNTMEIYEFKMEYLSDSDISLVKKYLGSEVDFPSNIYEFTKNEKVEYDFDNDGVKEKLLILSNGHSYAFSNSNNVFRVVLYVDGSEIQEVFKDVAVRGSDNDNFFEYSVSNIFKFSNQSHYSIILNRTIPMGECSFCPTLMEFNGNVLEEKVTCEEGEK